MAGLIYASYPNTDTVALTCTLNSLASDTNLLAGRQCTAISNVTNNDLDAIISGQFKVGTSPTSGNLIYVYAFGPRLVSSGTPTYPDTLGATDANVSITSANIRNNTLKLVCALTVDATTGRVYDIPPTSLAMLFGGSLPLRWGLWVVHNTGVALDASAGGNLYYTRVQAQYT